MAIIQIGTKRIKGRSVGFVIYNKSASCVSSMKDVINMRNDGREIELTRRKEVTDAQFNIVKKKLGLS